MNIYEKLSSARLDLQKKKLKKSGFNKYAGFNYYELGDFLPAIVEICKDYKLTTSLNFNHDIASLKIIDSEKPEDFIETTMPVAGLTLKGAHEIQNLGGIQTYITRYLFMNAFCIVENDYFDSILGKEEFEKNSLINEINDMCKKKINSGTDKKKLIEYLPDLKCLNSKNVKELRIAKSKLEAF